MTTTIETHPDRALRFDAETHTYRVGSRVVPSVTQVISAVVPGWQAAPWYLERGTAIHLACRYLDEERLDWKSVDDKIAGQVRAWMKFKQDYPSETVLCEQPMAHPVYGFAGTIDRLINHDGDYVVVDLKSSLSAQARLQLAAYSMLIHRVKARAAVAVELRDNGSYSTLWMNAKALEKARRQFLAALTVYGFMQEFQLTKGSP